ncbi:MAG: ABC transporter substrate-binding protein [Thermomicrobiales bacterium]
MASLVHDSLLGYDSADGTIVGHLATAWEMTDPTTMRLTLREGVTFHDGSPVTAEDVKATLDRAGNPDAGMAWHGLIFTVMSVSIVDATTVEVVTAEVFGPLEKSLTVAPIFPSADIADPTSSPSVPSAPVPTNGSATVRTESLRSQHRLLGWRAWYPDRRLRLHPGRQRARRRLLTGQADVRHSLLVRAARPGEMTTITSSSTSRP